jgi:DNA-directed RNA polymerase subunit omega
MGFLAKFSLILLFYCKGAFERHFPLFFPFQQQQRSITLRDDYLKEAQKKITDPMILINVISRRAKQLKSGYKPLIESLERLSAEDMALREVMEGKITYQLAEEEED